MVWAWHVWSGHTWTTERVRYMQARLQSATSLLRTNCVGVGAGWVGAVLTGPLFLKVNRIHTTKLIEFILLVGVPKSSMCEVLLLTVVAVFFSCSCGMFILCSLRSAITCIGVKM